MTQRLASGGRIDRARKLQFEFDGCSYYGFAGDTLASALLANGVRLVGRSFKYHRPRGIFTAGSGEPNALVELRDGDRREPNTKATTVELYDGLQARSQNRFPSLRNDLLRVNQLFAPLLHAGFYYKTFMWPSSFWEKVYEPAIRRAAGLGRAARLPDPDSYEKATAFCDVLVIGGGINGMREARAAATAGQRVLLCEADFELGGMALAARGEIDHMPATAWLAEQVAWLSAAPNVTILRRTSVFGLYDGNVYGAVERNGDRFAVLPAGMPRQILWRIRAGRAVLATGAVERALLFGGNDRPGVMLAGAVRSYVNRYAAAPGQRLAFYTNNDSAWQAAFDCADAGLTVAAIVDARGDAGDALRAGATARAIPVFAGSAVRSTRGGLALRAIEIADASDRLHLVPVDCLGVSGGWSPNIALATHLGARATFDDTRNAFVATDLPLGLTLAGAATGDAPRAAGPVPIAAAARGKAFVDLQHDVTRHDVTVAHAEGFTHPEHLKRYTTLGMATDQGRTSSLLGLAAMAELRGSSLAATGTTTARPPLEPVAIGALAGAHRGREFRPLRKTATHDWANANGAVFFETGLWQRAQWYRRPGESDWMTSVNREVEAVRNHVGVCDVSTLGKIDIQGADAARFLDFVYCNLMSTLPVGKVRYGLMLREDGFVFDDGTAARLAADHFVISTTTANADAVMEHLEWCSQVLRPDLDVQLASVSEQWAQFSIAGPRSRATLQALVEDPAALEDSALPFMGVTELSLRDGPRARLFRISFSGERAYELAVPTRYGEATMRALLRAGAPFGIMPYGTEALGVLRIEKGHAAGPELDGNTTASDLGLGRMLSAKKDFVGRMLAQRPALLDPARPRLVGLQAINPEHRFHAGAHLLLPGRPPSAAVDHGHVTSVAWSPSLGRWIGLGLLRDGAARIGQEIRGYDMLRGADTLLEICAPVFIDPAGERMRG